MILSVAGAYRKAMGHYSAFTFLDNIRHHAQHRWDARVTTREASGAIAVDGAVRTRFPADVWRMNRILHLSRSIIRFGKVRW